MNTDIFQKQLIYEEKDFNDLCKIKKCKNLTYIIVIDNNNLQTLKKFILNSDNNNEFKIKFINELMTKKTRIKCFLLCEKHLIIKYKKFLEIIQPNITDSEFLKILKNKINEWECNAIYSFLYKNENNLRKTLFNILDNSDEMVKAFSYMNSEFRWFIDISYYKPIPIYWQRYFILNKYIGNTKEQGKLNGPDFIFKDTFKNETIGFEIFELNPTMFCTKNIRNLEKFMEARNIEIDKKGGNLTNNITNLINKIKTKIEKWQKYQITNKKYIGVVINNWIPDEWYIIMELLINNIDSINNHIQWVFIL